MTRDELKQAVANAAAEYVAARLAPVPATVDGHPRPTPRGRRLLNRPPGGFPGEPEP